MKKTERTTSASPEWLTGARSDRAVNESVRGGWGVFPAPIGRGSAYTDISEHIMSVPEGDDEVAQAVRAHELAHARFSPTDIPVSLVRGLGLIPQVVTVAEELRVNSILGGWGSSFQETITKLSDGSERGTADAIRDKGEWNSAVLLMASTYGTDAFRTVKRRLKLRPEWREPCEVVTTVLRQEGERLSHHRSTDPYLAKYADGRSVCEVQLPEGFVNGTIPFANRLAGLMEKPRQGARVVEGDTEEPNLPKKSELRARWVPMNLGMTSLIETTAKFVGRRRRAFSAGKHVRYPDRVLTDPERRVFAREVRGVSGTVVIDASGSMSLTDEELTALLHHSPGCTVVAYSTRSAGTANAYIVARGGRRVTRAELERLPLRAGNGCDLPVLEWAVQQRKNPRDFILWVSDGYVTGANDHASKPLALETLDFITKHRISNPADTDEALQVLADLARGRSARALLSPYLAELRDKYKRKVTP